MHEQLLQEAYTADDGCDRQRSDSYQRRISSNDSYMGKAKSILVVLASLLSRVELNRDTVEEDQVLLVTGRCVPVVRKARRASLPSTGEYRKRTPNLLPIDMHENLCMGAYC